MHNINQIITIIFFYSKLTFTIVKKIIKLFFTNKSLLNLIINKVKKDCNIIDKSIKQTLFTQFLCHVN